MSKDLSKLSLDLFLLSLSVVDEFLEFLQGANGAHFILSDTNQGLRLDCIVAAVVVFVRELPFFTFNMSHCYIHAYGFLILSRLGSHVFM